MRCGAHYFSSQQTPDDAASLEHTWICSPVFIGNNATHQVSGWMVTPRGTTGYEDRCVQRHYRRAGFLPRRCRALGIAVTVVATDLGAEEQGQAPGITVHSGRLLPRCMAELLQSAAGNGCHPPLRGGSHQKHPAPPAWRGRVPPAACRQHLARGQCAGQRRPGRAVFSRNAGQCSALRRRRQELTACGLDAARLYPRVLPTVAGITACEGRGHRTAISLPCRGPRLNLALMQQFHIRYLVWDGGSGRLAEKSRLPP